MRRGSFEAKLLRRRSCELRGSSAKLLLLRWRCRCRSSKLRGPCAKALRRGSSIAELLRRGSSKLRGASAKLLRWCCSKMHGSSGKLSRWRLARKLIEAALLELRRGRTVCATVAASIRRTIGVGLGRDIRGGLERDPVAEWHAVTAAIGRSVRDGLGWAIASVVRRRTAHVRGGLADVAVTLLGAALLGPALLALHIGAIGA